jgi:ATP adenylyltransferase
MEGLLERLWAGWRMTYIVSHSPEDACLFCACGAAENDREVLVLERGERCFTMLNAYPYTSGHLMVAPYRHVATISDLGDDEAREMMALLARAERALGREYRPQGLNMGINLGEPAGAGIPKHLHAHLVPRWIGDSNFMTTVAETRVMPEALGATFERLARALADEPIG